jgi:ABC-type phosphate transport system auxiliary subunit
MAEIEESIQETSLQLAQLQSSTPPKTAAELAQREREFKRLTDQLQSLNTALQLQRTLGSEEQRRQGPFPICGNDDSNLAANGI